jgi:hypothetical protein
MLSFLTRHASRVKGVLSGFDRVRFRGTLRWLAHVKGLLGYLSYKSVLLKEFKEHAVSLTESIKQATKQIASEPIEYLPSSQSDKQDVACEIAEREGITEGLVCVLSCVEPCLTFEVGPNKPTKKLVDRRFDPQHRPLLVVHLHRVAIQGVPDARAFRSASQVREGKRKAQLDHPCSIRVSSVAEKDMESALIVKKSAAGR